MKTVNITIGTLLLLAVTHVALIAQQKPVHEKKVYVDEDGKTYWNKLLPVYVHLSTSPNPEDGKTFNLKSDTSKKYVDPYYFDTEGANFMRTKWAMNKDKHEYVYPLMDVLWEVYADGIAPVTKVKYEGSKTVTKDDKVIAVESLNLTLTATDQVSGTENIYYSVDGASYQTYSEPLKFTEQKNYTIKYYAVDNVGNVEEEHVLNLAIDRSSPESKLSIEGKYHENIVGPKTVFVINSTDEFSGVNEIFYSVDGSAERKYYQKITMSGLKEGVHTITYYAQDELNNKEEPNTFEFYVDLTGPILSTELLGDKYYANGKTFTSGRTRVKIVGIDNKAGIEEIKYAINSGEYEVYEEPFFLKNAGGQLRLKFQATDKVGNTTSSADSGEGSSDMPFLDLAGPNLNISYIGPKFIQRDTLFIGPQTKIKMSAYDPESGLQKIIYGYDAEGDEFTTYQEPFGFDKPGFHHLYVLAYDNVINQTNKEIMALVDDQGPEIFERFSTDATGEEVVDGKKLMVYPSHTVVFLSVTDDYVPFQSITYSMNGSAEKVYTGPIKGFKDDITIHLLVKSKDILGNVSEKEISFKIKD